MLKYLIKALPSVLALIAGFLIATIFVEDSGGPPPVTNFSPDTVQVPGLRDTVLVENERGVRIVERLTTREIPPDTVFVDRVDTLQVPVQRPPWGIVTVVKEGTNLQVDAISEREAQRLRFTLPEVDSNYTLRSGQQAASLRAGRRTGFRFGAEAGTEVLIGTDGHVLGVGKVVGPISYGSPTTRVYPVGIVESNGRAAVGVGIRREFFGGI